MAKATRKHEPLIFISKREAPLKVRIVVRIAAVIVALLLCALLSRVMTGDDPWAIMKAIFDGTFGTLQRFIVTIHDLAILLCISLAVTPAFKMKFWNTGAEGQVLIACLSTAIVMLCLGGKVADWLLIIIMAVAAIVSGTIWAVIPAVFKVKWGTNETLFTLMMNYVAIQLIEFFLKIADKTGSNVVGPALLSHGWLPNPFGVNYLFNIIVVAAMTIFIYIYLNYSKHGYEVSVVGESQATANYIGINVKKVVIRTMALSGAICGVVGLLLVGGASHSVDSNLADGRGFTAIMVAWLAKFNPIVMIFMSFLIVFMQRGALDISSKFGLNGDFADILTGIILFFIIGSEFFLQYKVHFISKKKEAE